MIEAGKRQRLAAEAVPGLRVAEHAGWQHLQRDIAVEMCVVSPIHDTHPAFADPFDDAIP